MAKQPRTPYDVTLKPEEQEALAIWLSDELDKAIAARSTSEREIAYYHTLYEQGRTRGGTNSPWPDAADLTSPIGTEKVDALRSRIVRTIFSEQVWTVEGWGDAASRAPIVEEFHNWQLEVTGFQGVFSKAVHLSLIEPRGVIEIYEDVLRRPIRKKIRAALALAPDGTALMDAKLEPVYQIGEDGKYVEVPDEPQTDPATGMPIPPVPSAETAIDDYELVSHGPRAREIAYRDYLQLPGHATSRDEVWGHAKRFYRTMDTLRERAEAGAYDPAVVESLGTDDERASETTLSEEQKAVAAKEEGQAEKELYEVTFLKKLDQSGYRWFVATIHRDKQTLLRLQFDDIGRPRYFSLVPFPKPHSTEGYSFIGNKLITVREENTAWRNMAADAGAVQLQTPMGRLQGALWDPDSDPWGPKSVITMRQRDEVFAIERPQIDFSIARERILDTERQGEKLAGMSDIASGSQPNEDRTLGETQLIAVNSEVRIEEVIRNIQEPLEEIPQVIHEMWKRALKEMPAGMPLPTSVMQGLETRGADVTQHLPDPKMTAQLLEGAFKFKPKGSVESADKPRQQRMFAEGMNALASLAGVNPMIGLILQQPQVAKALIERWIYLYGGGLDKSAFLGPLAMQLLQTQMGTPGMLTPGGAVPPGAPVGPPQEPPTGAPV
jgi:hypothetical protein